MLGNLKVSLLLMSFDIIYDPNLQIGTWSRLVMQATSYPPWDSMHNQIIYFLLNFAGVGDSLVLEGSDEEKILLDAGSCLSNALHYYWLVK